MSRSPLPASDITRDTEHDVLYYDSHHVRHDSADKVFQIAVKVNTTKKKQMNRRQRLWVTQVVIYIVTPRPCRKHFYFYFELAALLQGL